MSNSKDVVISAQVILRPASGRTIHDGVKITSTNIAEFAPSPDDVSSVTGELRARGFEIGHVVGISFSLTGTIDAFEKLFRMRIRRGKDGAYEFVAGGEVVGHELTGKHLPEVLRETVHAVAFPLPPDFGPTRFDV